MPKVSRVLKEFHGGLNSHAERRDVAKNELTQANDLQVDQIGKVVCMSSNIAATNGIIDKGITTVNPGYGLMHFQHDYAGMGNTYTSNIGLQNATAISTSYTVLASTSTYQYFYIYGHPQDDKIGVELISLQANREFNGTGNWASGAQYGTAYGTPGTTSTIDLTGDMSLNTGNISVICAVYLISSKAPMSVGVSYKLTFDVANLNGTHTLEDAGGNIITTISSNGSKEIQFISQGAGGFVILSPAATNSTIDLDNFSLKEGSWSQYFTLGSLPNFKMIGFVVDGGLRIHDANFDNTYTPKFFGYIERTNFSDAMSGKTFQAWYSDDTTYSKPLVSAATATAGKFTYGAVGGVTGAIKIALSQLSNGNWDFQDNDYQFYISYIYDGGYDSDLTEFYTNSTHSLSANNQTLGLEVDVKIGGSNEFHNYHSPRTVGFRIYYKKTDSLATSNYIWCLQEVYWDRLKGLRNPLDNKWNEWQAPSGGLERVTVELLVPPEILTYQDINGYNPGENLDSSFKAVCVANRKTYIGNIKNNGTVYGDMMIKSPVNGFDVLPISRSLEVTIADGDEIVQLEEYADRILQFKRNKMHLINVSQEIEFLEDTFIHKGVSNPNATCKTDFGVAWVNKHGCYLYDGKQVTNLLERKNIKLIDEDDWAAHVGEKSIIEYLPKKRQLIVIKDYSSASGGKNIYLFDMVTQSWVTSDDAIVSTNVDMTNTVIDKNGDLMWSYKGATHATFLKWSTTPVAQTNFALRTKALAFGNPAQRKKIYKVYVTHKNAGASQLGLYGEFHSQKATGGQGVGELSNDFFFGYLTPDSNTNNFIQQEFSVPAANLNGTSIDFNSVYTMRLYILSNKVWSSGFEIPGADHEGTAPKDFAINDITVVYRLKSVK